jgi:hypothetical protein
MEGGNMSHIDLIQESEGKEKCGEVVWSIQVNKCKLDFKQIRFKM